MAKKYKIVYDRSECIGAAACAAVAPEYWEMMEDGTAILVGAEDKEGGKVQELIITEEGLPKEALKALADKKNVSPAELAEKMNNALSQNKEAAEVCPVQVIHIYDLETGEKII